MRLKLYCIFCLYQTDDKGATWWPTRHISELQGAIALICPACLEEKDSEVENRINKILQERDALWE